MLSMHDLSLSMPEPMLSLSMTILAKSSDLGQMKSLDADAYHLTLRISLHCVAIWERSKQRKVLHAASPVCLREFVYMALCN